MATIFTGVRIDELVLKWIKKQANKEGRTPSGIINKLLKEAKDAHTRPRD